MNYWDILGIDATDDKKAVKRAYSKKLKNTRPDDNAAGYQILREAFDWAIQHGVYYYSDNESDGELDPVNQNQLDDYGLNDLQESQPETKDPHISAHLKAAQDAIDELFLLKNEEDMINLFDSWLISGELSNLKVRESFSDMCFDRAISSVGETSLNTVKSVKYPIRLYRHMANEFGWLTTLQTDYFKATNQASLQVRFDSYGRYQELKQSLEQSWYTDLLDADYWRAKYLLGPLATILFSVISRLGVFNFLIRKGIKEFEHARQFQLIPEIETTSFAWWEGFLSTPRLSLLHVFYGYFFAQALYYEPKLSDLIGLNSWALLILCLAFSTLVSYVLTEIHFKLSQADEYSNNTEYFWYGVLVTLTCMMFIFEDEISRFIWLVAILVCTWKLIGFVGYFHMIAIMVVSGVAVDMLGFKEMANWEYALGFFAVTNYFTFNLILPHLPRWLINATMQTGAPHVLVVSAMTSISIALISYLQRLV